MMMPMGFPGQQQRSPGRPNADPEQQKQRDRMSAAMAELEGALPKQAKETRFHIFKLVRRSGTWIKSSSKPTLKIYLSEWKEEGLGESDALRGYLQGKLGPGCYQITACDAHGNSMPRVPSWTEDLYQEGDAMTDSREPRGRSRGRGRFRRGGGAGRDPRDLDDGFDDGFDEFDDFDDDFYPPPRGGRGDGIMDFIETTKSGEKAAAVAAAAAATAQAQSQNDTMKMIMLQSQQQREADDRRRSEEQQRQDRAREDRRADEARLEERRREERRDDERRRDEERKVDREREERKASERGQMIQAMIATVVPALTGLMAPKKDDTMSVVLAKVLEPKPQDPILATLLAKLLEGTNQKGGLDSMLEGLVKMQSVGSDLQAKQMSNIMTTSQELQSKLMIQALAAAKGSGDEGWFDKLTKLLPALPGIIAAANPPAAAAPVAPRQIAQQPAPAPVQPVTVAQVQPQPQQVTGYEVVARTIIALHQRQYTTETERQQIVDALVAHAPHELKLAIANGDQNGIITLCTPTFTGNPNYLAWLGTEGAVDFIMNTAAGLQPMFAAQLGVILEAPPAAEVPPAAPEAQVTQVQSVPADARPVEQVAVATAATASGAPDLG